MKLETLTFVDTTEFQKWAEEKHGMSNHEWYKKIWNGENGLCDYILNESYRFSKTEEPENLLEEHINEFLDDFPELNNSVRFIFTN